MGLFKKQQQPQHDPENFSYQYRGYTIELRAVGLEYVGTLGRFAAQVQLSRIEDIDSPYDLKSGVYGNDIWAICAETERKFDKLLKFWEDDKAHKAETNQRLRKFTETNWRFN